MVYLMNSNTAKAKIIALGFKSSDFSVKSITGFATSVCVKIRAKNAALTNADFAKVEAAFPYGVAMVYNQNNSTMEWAA